MTVPLSNRTLIAQGAKVESCLRACGAQIWPKAALWQYQDEREKKAFGAYFAAFAARIRSSRSLSNTLIVATAAALVGLVSPAVGGVIFGLYLSSKLLFHSRGLPTWRTNGLLENDLYWRDGEKQRLPDPAQRIVDATRIFFPNASFAVSFLGNDPILHVLLNGLSYAALVWDVNVDGSVEIVSPPAC